MAVSSFFAGMGEVVFARMNSQMFCNDIPGVYVFIHREHGTSNFFTKRYAASTDNMLVIQRPSAKIRRGSFRNYIEFHGVRREISGIHVERTYGTHAFLQFESNEDSLCVRDDLGAPLPQRFQDEFMKGLLIDFTSLSETGSTISFGVVFKNGSLNFEGTGFKFCQVELAPKGGGDRQTLVGIQLPHEDDYEDVPSNSLLSQPLDIKFLQISEDQRSLVRQGLIIIANYKLLSKSCSGNKSLSESDSDVEDNDWENAQLSPSTEEAIGVTQTGQFGAGDFENWLSCFRTPKPILRALTRITYLLAKQRVIVKQRLHVLIDTENYVLRVQKAWEQENNAKAKICRSGRHNFVDLISGDEATVGMLEDGFNAEVLENWLMRFTSNPQELDNVLARLAAYLREEVRISMGKLQAIREAFEYAEKRKVDWKAHIDRRQSWVPCSPKASASTLGGSRRTVRRYGRGGQRAVVGEALSRKKSTAFSGGDGSNDVREKVDLKMKGKAKQEIEADDSDVSMDSDDGGVAVDGYMLGVLAQMTGTCTNHPVTYPSALLPLPAHMLAMTLAPDHGNANNNKNNNDHYY